VSCKRLPLGGPKITPQSLLAEADEIHQQAQATPVDGHLERIAPRIENRAVGTARGSLRDWRWGFRGRVWTFLRNCWGLPFRSRFVDFELVAR
jgi:hypothetical protein